MTKERVRERVPDTLVNFPIRANQKALSFPCYLQPFAYLTEMLLAQVGSLRSASTCAPSVGLGTLFLERAREEIF